MIVKSGWVNKLVQGEQDVPRNIKEAMEWLNQQRIKVSTMQH